MNRIVTIFLAIISPIIIIVLLSQQIVTAQPVISDPHIHGVDAEAITVTGEWQATADALDTFVFTMTVANNTSYTFTNLLLTATVPSNANYVSGGVLVGNQVQQSIDILAPGCCETVSFFFTATQTIGSSNYGLSASVNEGGLTALTEGLMPKWNNWSWGTTSTLTTTVVYTGSSALAVEHFDNFAGLFFHGDSTIGTDDIAGVRFWIHGGSSGGQNLGAQVEHPDGSFSNEVVITPTANVWTKFEIPLTDFGTITDVQGIVIQSRLPAPQPLYYVDEVGLIPAKITTNVPATAILLPNLQIIKSGPATAASGAAFAYTISVTNQGPGVANNLLISDVLPAGASYVSGGTLNGNVVELTISQLNENTTTAVQFSVSATQTVTNSSYEVIADGGFTATGSNSVTTVVQPPDLSILKRGPMAVQVGSPIPYKIRVTNSGTTPATNLVITDTLPANTSWVSGGSLNGNIVTWNLLQLNAGAATTVTLLIMPDIPTSFPASVVNNDYAVSANGGYSADGSNSVTTKILGTQLAVSKQGPAEIALNELLTYTLTITNSGTLTATDVTLNDRLPDGVIYNAGGSSNGITVTFLIPFVSPNSTITREFSVTPDPDEAPFLGTLFNDTYGITNGDMGVITGTDIVSTTVAFPDLSIDKTGPGEVTAGDPIVYELTVLNSGLMAASNLVITDTLPAGATFVGADNMGSLVAGDVRWNLATLAPGSSAIFHFTITAESTVINQDYAVSSDFSAASGQNSVVTTVGAAGFVVHLALIANHADGSEPNDSCSEAYELELNQVYTFHPDDVNDFYIFDLPSAANLDIFLTNFFPVSGQIVLYQAPDCGSLQFVASNGDFSATKTISAGVQPAGRYLIWVINDGAISSSQMYSLEVSSP